MATVRGDGLYKNSENGLSRWVETATCIGVRLDDNDQLELATPLGIEDLMNLILRPNPKIQKNGKFQQRIQDKAWLKKWPKLQVIE